MAGRRRRVTAGGLAGWLFADLALVLAFVFLDSSTQGQAGGGPRPTTSGNVTTTSTTMPDAPKGNGGARPEPFTLTVSVMSGMNAATIISRVERQLDEVVPVGERDSAMYLVVIALGGSRGGSRDRGSALATEVCNKLENSWSHVIKGTTFFQPGDDGDVPDGEIKLKLFPAQLSQTGS